ncbi:MAG: AAA family ATPase [bacterium]
MADDDKHKKRIEEFSSLFRQMQYEISKVMVGNTDVIEKVLVALFSGGHVLLESVPGLGKTSLVKALSRVLGLKFHRIQFTPDLMPADITGTHLVVEDEQGKRKFEFNPGPVFANLLLADEINRATPKTQSAFLEAMAENQVSVGGTTYQLELPFFVMATQNPIDMDGTYPLPEAQMDRFIFKLHLYYTDFEGEGEIIRRTTGGEIPEAKPVLEEKVASEKINSMKELVREVLLSKEVEDHIVKLVYGTRPQRLMGRDAVTKIKTPEVTDKYVNFGASPRGTQSIVLASKVYALLDNRPHVCFADVDQVLFPSLCHRLMLNFEADVDNKEAYDVLEEIKEAVLSKSSFASRQVEKIQDKVGFFGRRKKKEES